MKVRERPAPPCPGPLIWFHVGEPVDAGILECPCGYIVVTGGWNDEAHSDTPLLTSPL